MHVDAHVMGVVSRDDNNIVVVVVVVRDCEAGRSGASLHVLGVSTAATAATAAGGANRLIVNPADRVTVDVVTGVRICTVAAAVAVAARRRFEPETEAEADASVNNAIVIVVVIIVTATALVAAMIAAVAAVVMVAAAARLGAGQSDDASVWVHNHDAATLVMRVVANARIVTALAVGMRCSNKAATLAGQTSSIRTHFRIRARSLTCVNVGVLAAVTAFSVHISVAEKYRVANGG